MYAEKLKELGVTLPAAPGKGGLYAPTKTFGENKLMYVSGCGCNIPGEESFGKLGQFFSIHLEFLLMKYQNSLGPGIHHGAGPEVGAQRHDERAGCAGTRPWVAGPHLQL